MSIQSIIAHEQPDNFAFTAENEEKIATILAKYPEGRQASAVMPLLDLAQRQHQNWIPMKAIEHIANRLDMAEIRVLEVASFYTMYNLAPVGKNFIQVCTTTPCMLRGAKNIVNACKKHISKNQNELSENKLCSWVEVECLGACVNAPMMQINQDYYEDLNESKTEEIMQELLRDKLPKPGSVKNRNSNAPEKGKTTLLEVKNA